MSQDDLERLLFTPWHVDYQRRVELGREAAWEPHLDKVRSAAGISTPDLDLLEAWFRPYGENLRPIAGAVEAVERLESMGFDLAVVSNVPLPGALYEQVLRRHGLLERLRSRRFSYDCATRKPSPALLRAALGDLELDRAEAVMVAVSSMTGLSRTPRSDRSPSFLSYCNPGSIAETSAALQPG